jgi:hypothetical protein
MSKVRLIKVTLVTFLIFSMGLETRAEVTLLTEMSLDSQPRFGGFVPGTPDSLLYIFGIAWPSGSTSIGVGWSHDVTASDVGHVFTVDSDDVNGMAEALTRPNPYFGIGITGQNSLEFSLESLLEPPIPAGAGNTVSFTLHVTDLMEYRANQVLVTIDDFSIIDTGVGTWTFGGALTARVYGDRVPEPTSFLLFVLTWSLCFRFRIRPSAGNTVVH